jgi:hypothetical protein
MDQATPSGPAEAVLIALTASLAKPGKADDVVGVLVKAAAIGGLAYLLMSLLDDATTKPAPLVRGPRKKRAARRKP